MQEDAPALSHALDCAAAARAPPPPLAPFHALKLLVIHAGLLGCAGVQTPAVLFAACHALRELRLCGTQPCTACAFASALASTQPPLVSLQLRHTRFEADDPGSAAALGAAVAALPELVDFRFLGALSKHYRGAAREVLVPLGRRGALTSLSFHDTAAGDLFEMFPRFPHLRELVVEASCAAVQAAPVAAALQALPALTSLTFVRAALSGAGMLALAEALAAVPSLRSLEIGGEELTSEDVVAFSAAFPALQHLERLAVLFGVGNAAAAALAQRASALAALAVLDLSYHFLDDDAAHLLCQGLCHCTALQVLGLGTGEVATMCEDAVQQLREALPAAQICTDALDDALDL